MGFRDWFGRSDKDRQEEIREHIALETQTNIDRGMSPEDAARAARVAFGSVAGTRQLLNEGRAGYWLGTLPQDFRYALRAIRRNLVLSCAVALILSVGIGMTTAVFSVLNALAFRPPVSADPDSFARILQNDKYGKNPQRNVASVPAYERLRTEVRSMRELAAWSGYFYLSAPLGASDVRKAEGLLTSCNFFSVFSDDKPRLGRFFEQSDCSMALPVTIISDRVWRDRFDADPEIIGTSTTYGGLPLTIVGVAVPPKLVEESAPDMWFPYTLQPYLKDMGIFPNRDWLGGSFNWLKLAGRLQPGSTRQAAGAEVNVLLSSEKTERSDGDFEVTDGSAWSMSADDMLGLFAIALAFPTVVVFIVCATVGTLLLSRAVGRQREIAIRLALGGGRRRLIQMLLAESCLLALSAGVISLVLVFKIPSALLEFLAVAEAPPMAVSPDWRVFAYMAVVTMLMAVFSGLTPSLESLNAQLGESLKGREIFSRRRGRSRLRYALVTVQVAFSMVLLVAAGSLLRAELRQADPGLETRHILYAELPQSLVGAGSSTQAALAASVESLPGIQSVAFSDSIPALFEGFVYLDVPDKGRETFLSSDVSPEFFQTFDIPILAGQNFANIDARQDTGEEPVIVSQRFAQRIFPQGSPLGQILKVSREDQRFRVIGVARDRATFGTRHAYNDGSFVYRRLKTQQDIYLFARFNGNTTVIARSLQSVLKTQTGALLSVSTIQSRLDEKLAILRNVRFLVLIMGAVGLTLALVGVYGVVSFTAAQRKRDFAIRVALGARRPTIFGTVMKVGLRPIPIAILAGVALSFAALKIVDSAQGLVPTGAVSGDPIPYLAAGIILLVAILAALALPAYRAMRSDPVDALREE